MRGDSLFRPIRALFPVNTAASPEEIARVVAARRRVRLKRKLRRLGFTASQIKELTQC